ncbi:MAG: alpha-glucosidase [Myxococcales bacterium]|nr:alpha-glucosidase [Myxococcales bacterium]
MSGVKRSLADDHGIRATLFSAGRAQRRKRRVIVPVLVGFFGALLLLGMLVARAWLLPGYNDKFGDPPLLGHLEIDRKLKETRIAVGAFSVVFTPDQGGQVFVSHQSEPQRRIWESVPGMSFVGATYGHEKVDESRGMFFFSDKATGSSCATQKLEQVTSGGGQAQLRGTLRCSGAGSAPYVLTFSAVSEHQLGFELRIDDDDLNRAFLTYASPPSEHVFGFGEQFTYFDLKGRRVPIWVQEQGLGRGLQPLTTIIDLVARAGGSWHTSYVSVPHYITSDSRSLLTENYEYQIFDLRTPDRIQVRVYSRTMKGRILHGRTPAELIQQYTEYSGRMRKLPDWVHDGAIVGIQGGTERVRQLTEKLHQAGAPVSAVWLQDWVGQRKTSFGKQLWWNWQLDRSRYPEWEALAKQLAAQNVRILTYVNPFLVDIAASGRPGRNLFAEARERGFLVSEPNGQPYMIPNTDFSAGLLDITNADARKWWKDVIRTEVLGIGSSGWMADFGEALPYDARLHSDAPARVFHNQYPEEWARLNREAITESGRESELVFFTRSGYRKSPGQSTLFWLGDQLVTWDIHDGLKSAIVGMLSGGVSGFGLNHSDAGGYTTIVNTFVRVTRSRELLWRWLELSALSPVMRTHEGNRPDDNFQIDSDEETLRQFARCAKLYKAWSAYRKQLVEQTERTGLPVARHLALHHPGDPNVYKLSFEEYLLGEDLLVAPITDPGVTVAKVYLPEGTWIHAFSGRSFAAPAGGLRIEIPAPLGQPALFVRHGSAMSEPFLKALKDQGLF